MVRIVFDQSLCWVAILLALAGCAGPGATRTKMMPVPEAYRILADSDAEPASVLDVVPYATDRELTDDQKGYDSERGVVVRVGFADVRMFEAENTQAVAELDDVRESGILKSTASPLDETGNLPGTPAAASREFARQLGDRLRSGDATDLVIYVPGFKVEFPDAVLVPAMFQSFVSEGFVFAGYSWPSTPSVFAYFRDLESTRYSARNLRLFLEYLAEETLVRRIHIIGFSAGTRLVAETLHQFSLMRGGRGSGRRELERLRIGEVVLVGSDLDREEFGNFLADGLLDVPERLTIYMSGTDSALGFAAFLFSRDRLGEIVDESTIGPGARRFLERAGHLDLVDVTGASRAREARGHAYFRYSPWVSGDVLLAILYGLAPEERGLAREPGSLIWKFPPDYRSRLEALAAE